MKCSCPFFFFQEAISGPIELIFDANQETFSRGFRVDSGWGKAEEDQTQPGQNVLWHCCLRVIRTFAATEEEWTLEVQTLAPLELPELMLVTPRPDVTGRVRRDSAEHGGSNKSVGSPKKGRHVERACVKCHLRQKRQKTSPVFACPIFFYQEVFFYTLERARDDCFGHMNKPPLPIFACGVGVEVHRSCAARWELQWFRGITHPWRGLYRVSNVFCTPAWRAHLVRAPTDAIRKRCAPQGV